MSRSLLHDWEYDIERCCEENLPCEMEEIIEDIYNTAYKRGKSSQEPILDKIRDEIEQITYKMGAIYNRYVSKIDVLEIIDKYRSKSEE